MIAPALIDRAVDLIVAHCAPDEVFVVGSYSTGTATDASDLDLLVIQDTHVTKQRRDGELGLLLAPLMIPVDVNVYSRDEFREELEHDFGFARSVTERQGRLVYSRALGDFAALALRWSGEASALRHARLRRCPGEWQLYQSAYAREVRRWPMPPWAFAAHELREHPEWTVADFGCGEGALARAVPNRTLSFDHCAGAAVAATECDLADVPLADASVEVVVLSLALIGANWRDYLREAARACRPGGRVFITELVGGIGAKEIAASSEPLGLVVEAIASRGPFVDIHLRAA
jgi:predicted nucleotidyltransferase